MRIGPPAVAGGCCPRARLRTYLHHPPPPPFEQMFLADACADLPHCSPRALTSSARRGRKEGVGGGGRGGRGRGLKSRDAKSRALCGASWTLPFGSIGAAATSQAGPGGGGGGVLLRHPPPVATVALHSRRLRRCASEAHPLWGPPFWGGMTR